MTKATDSKPKNASEKGAKKDKAAPAPAPEETVAAAPEAPAATEAPAPEEEAPQAEASEAPSEAELRIEDLFDRVSSLFEGTVPAGFRFAPEGFAFGLDGDEEGETGCCGAVPSPDEVFEAGVQAGLRRANHPVFGIGIASAPVPAKPQVALTPINVVDDTTAAFAHLVDLKKLHEVGILTDAEFDAKKADILRHVY